MDVKKTSINSEKTRNFKIWKSNPSADAAFMVTPDTAFLIGNEKNFVAASPVGVCLTGNVTFNCLSEQRRQGGLFITMNDFVRMVPQTIVTPIPSQIPFPPIAFPLSILVGLPFFIAMLA
jgi:hypothetical protein